MRKLLGAFTISLVLVLVPNIAASANSNHQEQVDGSDHGATSKPSKDDPSSNGKDCELHGNNGGINEDHCNSILPVIVDDPIIPVVEDDVTPVVEDEDESETQLGSETKIPVNSVIDPVDVLDTPHNVCSVDVGFNVKTNVDCVLLDSVPIDVGLVATPTAPPTELPRTGSGVGLLALVGFLFVMAGVSLQLLLRPLAIQ